MTAPGRPSRRSFTPPTGTATTGRAAARASIRATGEPSDFELRATTPVSLSRRATSPWLPRKRTKGGAARSRAGRSGPSPAMRSSRAGRRRRASVTAAIRRGRSFTGTSRATAVTTGGVAPSRGATAAKASRSRPRGTVRRRPGEMRRPSRSATTAGDTPMTASVASPRARSKAATTAPAPRPKWPLNTVPWKVWTLTGTRHGTATRRPRVPALAVWVWRMWGRKSPMSRLRAATARVSSAGRSCGPRPGTWTSRPSRPAASGGRTASMSPSSGAGAPVASSVSKRRRSRRETRMATWVAVPPTLRRAMT